MSLSVTGSVFTDGWVRGGADIAAWQPSPGDRPMYEGPDVPSADLPEDITGPEPQLVPLDVSTLHKVPGYETVGYYADCEYRISDILLICSAV